jgi:phage replication-related protein YjqB (UPF0714/DUF867 family)
MTSYRSIYLLAGLILVLAAVVAPALADGDIGYLRVTSSPGGAYIYVDDTYRGQTAPSSGQSQPIELQAGMQHTVRVAKDGYQDYATTAIVVVGEYRDLTANLLPTTTPNPTFGTILVSSNPGGANVYIDGTYYGLTPTQSGQTLSQEVLAGKHRVSIQLQGYTTYSTTVSAVSGESTTVSANLQSESPDGSIQVSSSPSGATITLDGVDSRVAPATFPNINVGRHTIVASMDGYYTQSQNVDVTAGQVSRLSLTMVPYGPTTGSARIQSVPTGADIYLDGLYRGSTPLVISNLATGSHTVLLRRAGYQEYSTSIAINAGSTTELRPTLSALPASVGSVDVVSYPAGAAVYLDTVYYGHTSAWDALDIPNLQPGEHAVTLSLSGYYDYVTTVTVNAGRTTNLAATLKDLPSSNPHGQVAVVSSPSGASVFIDNVYQGITPMTVLSVKTGAHTVLVRQSGYQDWTTSIQVAEGETAQVSATLAESGKTTATTAVTSAATTAAATTTTKAPTATPTATKSGLIDGLALVGCALAALLLVRARR